MTEVLLTRVLSGDATAIAAFGGFDICAVVDWRDGPAEIIKAVSSFLPAGYLSAERTATSIHRIRTGGRAPQVLELGPESNQEDAIDAINRLLLPTYEIRQFTPVDGDGYALYVAPARIWRDIDMSHPTQTAKYFLPTDRLATYSRKGSVSRLFSKP